jgi:hypothetical protein
MILQQEDLNIRIPLGYNQSFTNMECLLSDMPTEDGLTWTMDIDIINSSVLVARIDLEMPLEKSEYYCILKNNGEVANLEMVEVI